MYLLCKFFSSLPDFVEKVVINMLEENLETQRRVRKSGRKNPKKKIILISAIAVLLLAVIVLFAVSVSMYNANTILQNVSVAGVPLAAHRRAGKTGP